MSEQDMLPPGQRLRAEREARGLSQEELARRLNLTVTFLDALETDDYERLPEAIFVRGYIRNYARELELPGDELVNVFDGIVREQEGVPETVEVMPARRKPWIPIVAVALVLAVAAALLLWQDNNAAGEGSVGEEPVAGDDEPVSPPEPETGTSGQTGEETPAADTEEPAGADPEVGEADEADALAGEAEGEPASGESAAPDQLEMSFSGECWLEVRDATGEVVFEGRRNAGVALTVSGRAPFDLRIGDASAVSAVSVNDEQQTVPSGTSGQVVRLSVP